MKRVLVNITALASGTVRHEKRNGRDVIIVPSATLPDNVVMNGRMYPAEEIAKSYKQLERTPAPLGHPMVNGKYVSSRDPEGLNQGWIGAWNENVRQEGGRVLLDKVIDVERAKQSEGGKAVLNAIDKGEPVHTSTGLLANMEPVANEAETGYKFIARDYEFDHDAILLDQDGAATPAEGVGMMVNSAGGEDIEVVNSFVEEADRSLDWAVESAVRAIESRRKAGLLERVKAALLAAISFEGTHNQQETDDMTVSKEQFDALSGQVKTLSEGVEKIGETVANAVAAALKPITDEQERLANAQKDKDDAELTELRGKIVTANLLDEDGAKELTLNAARKLAEKVKTGNAAPLNPAFMNQNQATGISAYKVPEGKAN